VKLPAIDPEALSKTPWVLGAAAILVGLAIFWLASIVSAFQHDAGYDFRQRVIHLLAPGNAAWAVAVLLAVALLALASTTEDKRSAVVGFVYQLLLLAAALITVAAVINAIIEITYIGSSFDLALSGFLGYLAAVPISAAAGLWAYRANPSGLPGKKSTTV
jgi:predicted lysophospholipase L1 biosynthesis ABC-type transport system permease subunit